MFILIATRVTIATQYPMLMTGEWGCFDFPYKMIRTNCLCKISANFANMRLQDNEEMQQIRQMPAIKAFGGLARILALLHYLIKSALNYYMFRIIC